MSLQHWHTHHSLAWQQMTNHPLWHWIFCRRMLLHNKLNPVSLSLSLLRQLRLNWMSCGGVEKRGASARAEQGFRQVLIRVEYLNPCLASGIHKVWPACKTLQIIVIFTCGDSYAGQGPLIVIIWQSHFLTNKDTLKLGHIVNWGHQFHLQHHFWPQRPFWGR